MLRNTHVIARMGAAVLSIGLGVLIACAGTDERRDVAGPA